MLADNNELRGGGVSVGVRRDSEDEQSNNRMLRLTGDRRLIGGKLTKLPISLFL